MWVADPAVNPARPGKDSAVVAARLARVARLTDEGWTAERISTEVGVSAGVVGHYRRKIRRLRGEAASSGVRIDSDLETAIVVMYTSGVSAKRTAAAFHVAPSTVERVLNRHGIPRRGRREAGRMAYEARVAAGTQVVPDARRPVPEHGTRARYQHRKQPCHCESCSRAQREYSAEWRVNRNRSVSGGNTGRST